VRFTHAANLDRFLADEQAVIPVIGSIFVVAVTVVLAAVIGAFVLDGGGRTVAAEAPPASFSFEYDQASSALTVTHESGGAIDASELSATSGDPIGTLSVVDSEVDAGDSGTVSGVDPGETVRTVWQTATGDGATSATIATVTAPSATIANCQFPLLPGSTLAPVPAALARVRGFIRHSAEGRADASHRRVVARASRTVPRTRDRPRPDRLPDAR
jgi:FlaG/FlaF family flagellin (archaellin)